MRIIFGASIHVLNLEGVTRLVPVWTQYPQIVSCFRTIFEPRWNLLRKRNTQTFLHQRQGTRKIKRSSLTFEMVLTSDTASHTVFKWPMLCTLPETNISPENRWLEEEFPFGMANFQGGSGRVMCLIGGVPLVLWNCWMFLLKRVYLLAYYHGWVQISVSSPC